MVRLINTNSLHLLFPLVNKHLQSFTMSTYGTCLCNFVNFGVGVGQKFALCSHFGLPFSGSIPHLDSFLGITLGFTDRIFPWKSFTVLFWHCQQKLDTSNFRVFPYQSCYQYGSVWTQNLLAGVSGFEILPTLAQSLNLLGIHQSFIEYLPSSDASKTLIAILLIY